MKKILLTTVLAFLLVASTIAIFSCEIIDLEIEDDSGAKVQGEQQVIYEQTVYDAVD